MLKKQGKSRRDLLLARLTAAVAPLHEAELLQIVITAEQYEDRVLKKRIETITKPQ
jgi:hypothetical protein